MGKKIVVVRHLLKVRIFMTILLGLAPIVKVGPQAPIFEGANCCEKNFRDSTSHAYYRVLANSIVREEDPKEDGGHVGGIRPDTVGNMHHLWP
jgi:hypothetical protein